MRRALTLGLLTAALLSAFLVSPAAADEHVPGANGCSGPFGQDWLVPDSGATFNFHAACDAHDRCYIDRPYGVGEYGRKVCDDQFYNRMTWDCVYRPFWPRQACYQRAGAYWYGVRTFGTWFYYDPNPFARANVRVA